MKQLALVYSPQAVGNLISIRSYIEQENAAAAASILNKIHDKVLLACSFPGWGSGPRQEIGEDSSSIHTWFFIEQIKRR